VARRHGTPSYTLGICRNENDNDENHSLLNPEHPLFSFYSVQCRYVRNISSEELTPAAEPRRVLRYWHGTCSEYGMTTLALGEEVGRFLAGQSDRVETDQSHDKVIHRVMIGKQVFVVTCEESAPDTSEPSV